MKKNNNSTINATRKFMRRLARIFLLTVTVVAMILTSVALLKLSWKLFTVSNQGDHIFLGFSILLLTLIGVVAAWEKLYKDFPNIIRKEEKIFISLFRISVRLLSFVLYLLSVKLCLADKYFQPKQHRHELEKTKVGNIVNIMIFRQNRYKRKNRRVG